MAESENNLDSLETIIKIEKEEFQVVVATQNSNSTDNALRLNVIV